MFTPSHSIHHLQRQREITTTFARHGFGFLFDQLEPEWRSMRRALHLPARIKVPTRPEDLAIHLRLALEELGPTFVKLGQILSTRPDLLPPEYITELARLQDEVPAEPWKPIHDLLTQELGRAPEKVFTHLDRRPMAAASLAQVYAATLPGGQEVVVKVQRPGITPVIEQDLEILSALAERAQITRLGKMYDFVGIAEDFRYTLLNELDYHREGRNADRFRSSFASEPHILIPKVFWEFSTRRVLVLERIDGIKISDVPALKAAGCDCHQLALYCTRMIIKEILEDGFFHADPHPGNYVVLPGDVIGVMDFGKVGFLRETDRLDLIRLYIVAASLDADGIVDQLVRMGAAGEQVERTGLARAVDRLLNKYNGLPLGDVHAGEVIEEIMPITFQHHLRLPGNWWLLAQALVMMEGIGMQLDPDFDAFAVAKPFIKRLMRQLVTPESGWAKSLLLDSANWGDLLHRLPGAGSRLVERIERDELFQVNIKETDRILGKLDQLATRLTLGVLTGAFSIGLAMLAPLTASGSLARWLLLSGITAMIVMGLWLLISLITASKP